MSKSSHNVSIEHLKHVLKTPEVHDRRGRTRKIQLVWVGAELKDALILATTNNNKQPARYGIASTGSRPTQTSTHPVHRLIHVSNINIKLDSGISNQAVRKLAWAKEPPISVELEHHRTVGMHSGTVRHRSL